MYELLCILYIACIDIRVYLSFLCIIIDVDECEMGACVQNCINFNGGYNCSCFEGYAFNSKDGKCDGKTETIP